MKYTKCVITTESNPASKQIRDNFGGNLLQGIIMIQDKVEMETEARTWIPVIKLNHSASVVGLVIVGDIEQFGPLQVRKQVEVNAFALQGGLSLYARLLQHDFGFTTLRTLYRMHPQITQSKIESATCHLKNHETTYTQEQNVVIDQFILNLAAQIQTFDKSFAYNQLLECE